MDTPIESEEELGTRAVVLYVEPGCQDWCSYCGRQIKFSAKIKPRKFVCNVYKGNIWDRLENYHFECYEEAGKPYGVKGPLRPPRTLHKPRIISNEL